MLLEDFEFTPPGLLVMFRLYRVRDLKRDREHGDICKVDMYLTAISGVVQYFQALYCSTAQLCTFNHRCSPHPREGCYSSFHSVPY